MSPFREKKHLTERRCNLPPCSVGLRVCSTQLYTFNIQTKPNMVI